MQITLVRLVFTGLVVDFLVAVFLVVDFLVLETANTVEKLFPHLNEE